MKPIMVPLRARGDLEPLTLRSAGTRALDRQPPPVPPRSSAAASATLALAHVFRLFRVVEHVGRFVASVDRGERERTI